MKPAFFAVSAFLIFAAIPTLAPTPAWAQATKSVGKFGGWEGFLNDAKTGKVCYAAASPTKSEGAPKTRTKPYAAVTNRPQDKSLDVVSFNAGLALKKNAPATLQIGPTKFDLYTDGNSAWSTNDKAIVAAMAKAKSMVLKTTPATGAGITDDFPLDGFAQANAAIAKACAGK